MGLTIFIRMDWDAKNNALFTEKLFRHARRGELRFTSEVNGPNVDYSLDCSGKLTRPELVKLLSAYLFARRSLENSRGKNLSEPLILSDGKKPRTKSPTKLDKWAQ